MAELYSIGELAQAAEVSTSSVRYYERIGLLKPAGRTAANYRYYDDASLQRLRFIRAAQGAGFTLEDVSAMLDLRDGSLAPCEEVQTLIEERLDSIARRMADYRRVQKELKACLTVCRSSVDPVQCGMAERGASQGSP